MELKLTRPLAFLIGIHRTNVVADRIVEISILKILPDGGKDIYTRRINPGIHIPEEVVAIHGITDEM